MRGVRWRAGAHAIPCGCQGAGHQQRTAPSQVLDLRRGVFEPPEAVKATADERPRTATLTGTVRLAESGELLVGASVAVLVGPGDLGPGSPGHGAAASGRGPAGPGG